MDYPISESGYQTGEEMLHHELLVETTNQGATV